MRKIALVIVSIVVLLCIVAVFIAPAISQSARLEYCTRRYAGHPDYARMIEECVKK